MSEDWTEKKCSSVVVTQDGEKNRFLTCGSVSPISHLIFEVNSYEENDGSVFLPDEEVIEKEEEQRSISQSWKYLVLFSFCLGIISPLGILLSRNELAGWLTSLFIFIFSALTLVFGLIKICRRKHRKDYSTIPGAVYYEDPDDLFTTLYSSPDRIINYFSP
ncbi:uncharacterized protein LOC111711940 isoform X1 [Eurytemora carolleeae]|uniref:uncharacterized protein LOC111711940 isoform X1 n=1 Tax=Eurytemora carolleeae TaxID=1294199 RepID=UPI000C78BFFD|nr:uncharacterized protein LOC111711940 isoform X1 [Eurytemora carolleeae]XP_023342202.1 uncharacterized protein LOC111711940 isoform X1 [Eurytemora carolleeae]XP_023342210.1 uncharacterized protein LOC111711940 isoform X1 [Eurytemora carolleeae]XP_023342216.1 uncharacterized protein LOC111711940 isoform X1 [Eurytemora carolleeae]|eukprot:XP_023342193.1 uncharacterized protein LOC111711940 isoform X1 [Eurytemora affinis]